MPANLTCDDFTGIECCDSCHDDEEFGYEMLDFGTYVNGVYRQNAYVCCSINWWARKNQIMLDTITKEELALRLVEG